MATPDVVSASPVKLRPPSAGQKIARFFGMNAGVSAPKSTSNGTLNGNVAEAKKAVEEVKKVEELVVEEVEWEEDEEQEQQKSGEEQPEEGEQVEEQEEQEVEEEEEA